MPAETPLGGPATIERHKVFSLTQANRTLPLVRRVVQDIVTTYSQLRSLQHQLSDTIDRNAIERDMDGQSRRLEQLQDELENIGCELKDPVVGLVDFVGRHQSRDIYLCWKLGEDKVAYWHELHAGVSARRPVDQLEE